MDIAKEVTFGPCCFCNQPIEDSAVNPCRVTVETSKGEWQVWFAHAKCFRERLVEREDGMFEPANF